MASTGVMIIVALSLVLNAAVVTARRRARDSAVLRACGATDADLRAATAWHGATTGGIVAVIGVAAGIVAGANTWRATAASLGVPAPIHVSPLVAGAIGAPIVVFVASALTSVWWARRRPGSALRAE